MSHLRKSPSDDRGRGRPRYKSLALCGAGVPARDFVPLPTQEGSGDEQLFEFCKWLTCHSSYCAAEGHLHNAKGGNAGEFRCGERRRCGDNNRCNAHDPTASRDGRTGSFVVVLRSTTVSQLHSLVSPSNTSPSCIFFALRRSNGEGQRKCCGTMKAALGGSAS